MEDVVGFEPTWPYSYFNIRPPREKSLKYNSGAALTACIHIFGGEKEDSNLRRPLHRLFLGGIFNNVSIKPLCHTLHSDKRRMNAPFREALFLTS